jgi:hypothetical protein
MFISLYVCSSSRACFLADSALRARHRRLNAPRRGKNAQLRPLSGRNMHNVASGCGAETTTEKARGAAISHLYRIGTFGVRRRTQQRASSR